MVRVAKWFTLGATYFMNTWASWATGSAAGVVLHSVPPLLVFVAAEAVTDLRERITDAVRAGVDAHAVHEPLEGPRPRRRTFDEYRALALCAWSPGVEVTPAWVERPLGARVGCPRGSRRRWSRTSARRGGHERW